jgi:NADP-reducing hydrogenase subunit HndB
MAEKIKSIAELKALREKARDEVDLRSGIKAVLVNVHMGTCGIAAGARDLVAELVEQIGKAGLKDVTVKQSGCAGLCSHEPMLTLTDGSGVDFRYGLLDRQKVQDIVRDHLVGGHPVAKYLIKI